MYHSVMVPLDGSPFGEHALPLALACARRSNAALHLVHVHAADAQWTAGHTLEVQLREHERAYLTVISHRLATMWPGRVAAALLDGPLSEALDSYVRKHQIDLVIMTTHGRGALSRAWLGSVADRLIRQLSVPILLVRPHETEPPDFDRSPRIGRVLIPLDGSALSEAIIPHALALGELTGASYTLVQALDVLVSDYGSGAFASSPLDIGEWMQDAQRYLHRVAERLRAKGLNVTTELLVGSPAVSILEYARDHAVDLIALETHGRSGAARLFLGSVADKLVRSAAVPVLLHRPPHDAGAPQATHGER